MSICLHAGKKNNNSRLSFRSSLLGNCTNCQGLPRRKCRKKSVVPHQTGCSSREPAADVGLRIILAASGLRPRAPELIIAFGVYLLPVVLLDLASVSAQLTSRLCNEGKQSGNQYAPRELARWHKQRPHRPLHDNNMLAAKHPC